MCAYVCMYNRDHIGDLSRSRFNGPLPSALRVREVGPGCDGSDSRFSTSLWLVNIHSIDLFSELTKKQTVCQGINPDRSVASLCFIWRQQRYAYADAQSKTPIKCWLSPNYCGTERVRDCTEAIKKKKKRSLLFFFFTGWCEKWMQLKQTRKEGGAQAHTFFFFFVVVSFSDVQAWCLGGFGGVGPSLSVSLAAVVFIRQALPHLAGQLWHCVCQWAGGLLVVVRVYDSVCPLHTLTVKLQRYNSGCCSGVPAVLA